MMCSCCACKTNMLETCSFLGLLWKAARIGKSSATAAAAAMAAFAMATRRRVPHTQEVRLRIHTHTHVPSHSR